MSEFSKDFFICHASEDKRLVAKVLYDRLTTDGYNVWYDEAEITWGESITTKVNWGLGHSRFVIVIISKAFLTKHWPNREFNAALNTESASGQVRILPLLVGTPADIQTIVGTYPLLNDKRYLVWNGTELDELAYEVGRLAHAPSRRRTGVSQQSRSVVAEELGRGWITIDRATVTSLPTMAAKGVAFQALQVGNNRIGHDSLDGLPHLAAQRFVLNYIQEAIAQCSIQSAGNSAASTAWIEAVGGISMYAAHAEVLACLADLNGISRDNVAVMVDEVDITRDIQAAKDLMTKFTALGMKVGLSRFGTGYSSLSYLKTLPISYLSVDQSFTAELSRDSSADAIMRAIGSLCGSLGLDAMAAGVTSTEQIEIVRSFGFSFAQIEGPNSPLQPTKPASGSLGS